MLKVADLSVQYRDQNRVVQAVNQVSFSVEKSQTMAVVGESGCGKSTLALSLFRLLPALGEIVSGQVWLGEQALMMKSEKQMQAIRGKEMGLILQDALSALNPVMQVGKQVAELYRHHFRNDRRTAKHKALELLERVKLPDVERTFTRYPHQLSGGQRQRVAIALALACHPKLLIADEPTTALDVSIQKDILMLLRELQQEMGLALLLISHDLAVVSEMADRVAVMYAGRIVEQGPVQTVFATPAHPYTQLLLDAVPRIGEHNQRRAQQYPASLNDHLPELGNQPAGCAFAPRCAQKQAACDQGQPDEILLNGEHAVRCFFAKDRLSGNAC